MNWLAIVESRGWSITSRPSLLADVVGYLCGEARPSPSRSGGRRRWRTSSGLSATRANRSFGRDLLLRHHLGRGLVAGLHPVGLRVELLDLLGDPHGRRAGPHELRPRCALADRGDEFGDGLGVLVLGVAPAVHAVVEVDHVELRLTQHQLHLVEQAGVAEALARRQPAHDRLALELVLDRLVVARVIESPISSTRGWSLTPLPGTHTSSHSMFSRTTRGGSAAGTSAGTGEA